MGASTLQITPSLVRTDALTHRIGINFCVVANDGEILPAGVVFDLNHPGDGLARRELTPPSPFTPRPRYPPPPQGEKRKHISKADPAAGAVVIDLTMVEDEEEVQTVEAMLGVKTEPRETFLVRSPPRKKVKYQG